jgi:hypothetical protein
VLESINIAFVQTRMLTDLSVRPKKTMLLVDFDATYRLEGKAFKIVPAANDNLSFEYLEEAPLRASLT